MTRDKTTNCIVKVFVRIASEPEKANAEKK